MKDISGENSKVVSRSEIDAVIAAAGDEFQLDDIAAKLGGGDGVRHRCENAVNSDAQFFCDNRGYCLKRSACFSGREFLITPDQWEIDNGFLIPGHRFLPFVDGEVFPSEVELTAVDVDGRKSVMNTRVITVPLGEIFRYHTLLGSDQLFDHLAAEDPANMRLSGHPSAGDPVTITVFDLSKFYSYNAFAPGDALRCRVDDYHAGKISFSFCDASSRSNRRLNDFVTAFDKALGETIENFRDYLDVPEQLAWSCFFGRDSLDFTAASLEEYLRYSLSVGINAEGDVAMLVLRSANADTGDEGNMDAAAALPDGLSLLPEGTDCDPAAIIRELGSSLTPQEIDGFILDVLASREDGFDAFMARALAHIDFDKTDEVRRTIVLNSLEERFEELESNFDRAGDVPKASLRSAVMEMVSERIELFNAMTEWSDDRRKAAREGLEDLAAVMMQLNDILKLLNDPAFLPDEKEIDRLQNLVDARMDDHEKIMETLEDDGFSM